MPTHRYYKISFGPGVKIRRYLINALYGIGRLWPVLNLLLPSNGVSAKIKPVSCANFKVSIILHGNSYKANTLTNQDTNDVSLTRDKSYQLFVLIPILKSIKPQVPPHHVGQNERLILKIFQQKISPAKNQAQLSLFSFFPSSIHLICMLIKSITSSLTQPLKQNQP